MNEGGFWVRNIDVAGTSLPSDSLSGWQTITQVHPQEVPGWTLQLVAIAGNDVVWHKQVKLDKSFRASLAGKQLRRAIGHHASTVAALVTMDDPNEEVTEYGKYSLIVKAPARYGNRAGR